MPKVRTTMNPLVELNVTDREAIDLAAQGILLDSTATTPAALMRDALAQSAERESPTGINTVIDEVPFEGNASTVGGSVPDDIDVEDTDDDEIDVDDDAADEADTERRVSGLLNTETKE